MRVKLIALVIMVFAFGLISSSFPPAMAEQKWATQQNGVKSDREIEHNHIYDQQYRNHDEMIPYMKDELSQAFQIKLLIGIVIFLFGGNMWWIRNYMKKQELLFKEQDTINVTLFKKSETTNHKLDGLEGEHRRSMQFNGCAADPSTLEETLKKVLAPFLEFHVHQRNVDK